MPSIALLLDGAAVGIATVAGAALGPPLARLVPLFREHDADSGTGPDTGAAPPPPSCPNCAAPVAWPKWTPLPLGPLSGGRCVGCGVRPGGPVVLVTVFTAGLSALLGVRFGWGSELPAFMFFAAVGVPLTVIDARVRRLPDRLVLASYPPALALLVSAAALAPEGPGRLLGAITGMAALLAFYWLLWFIHPAGMGWGDVKLAGLLGLYLGWIGLTEALIGTFLAFLLSAVFGVTLLALGRATRKTQIPFGPFMLLGAFAVVLLTSAADRLFWNLVGG